MTDTYTLYQINYGFGAIKIPVQVQVFDDGRNLLGVSSKDDLFREIVHRSCVYLDKSNSDHFFEELGEPPALFSCFSDHRCSKFLKGLLFTILADYDIGLRLFQVTKN